MLKATENEEEFKVTGYRLPINLTRKFAECAKKEHRSASMQLTILLENYCAKQENI